MSIVQWEHNHQGAGKSRKSPPRIGKGPRISPQSDGDERLDHSSGLCGPVHRGARIICDHISLRPRSCYRRDAGRNRKGASPISYWIGVSIAIMSPAGRSICSGSAVSALKSRRACARRCPPTNVYLGVTGIARGKLLQSRSGLDRGSKKIAR
jgi:hypothetical protein